MFKLKWGEVQSRLTDQLKELAPEQPVRVDFIFDGEEPQTRNIRCSDLMTNVWRLFDNRRTITHIRITLPNGELLFHYNAAGDVDENIPEGGNADGVRFYVKRTPSERKALMAILCSQLASHLYPQKTGRE